jgi:hypothetical protein
MTLRQGTGDRLQGTAGNNDYNHGSGYDSSRLPVFSSQSQQQHDNNHGCTQRSHGTRPSHPATTTAVAVTDP